MRKQQLFPFFDLKRLLLLAKSIFFLSQCNCYRSAICHSLVLLTFFLFGPFYRRNKSGRLKVRVSVVYTHNPSLNDKILDLSKLKVFADDKMIVAKMMSYVFDRAENIVGKGENAGYQHFLLFSQCFQKAFSSGVLKVVIVW